MQNQTEPIELLGTQGAAPGTPESGAGNGESELGSWLSPALLLLGVSLLTWIMVRMLIRNRRKFSLTSGTPRERLDEIRRKAGQRAKVDAFAADATELVQRLAAQLDAKAARIELLIEDADERLRLLERAQRQGGQSDGRAGASEATRTATSKNLVGGPVGEGSGNGAGDAVAEQVYELADQGEAPIAIAKRLNQHVGQVELILALRRA